MTALQAVTRLLRNFSPEEQSIPSSVTYPGRVEDCLDALNDAFTELVELSPSFLRKDSRGKLLNDPAAVTMAVTAGSTAATIAGASYATWMPGCTVVIAGSSIDNEILEAAASGGDYILTLRYPFDGSTGNASATVFHDAVTIAATELEIIEPLQLFGAGELHQVGGPSDLNKLLDPEEDYGRRPRRSRTSSIIRRSEVTDAPAVYWVESHVPSAAASEMVRRLRIFPLPRAAATLAYEARIAQPVYATADGTVIPLSERHASAILMPVATYLLTRSPFFRAGNNTEAIKSGYEAAIAMARELNPKPRSGFTFKPRS
jgi:hypothetical protein